MGVIVTACVFLSIVMVLVLCLGVHVLALIVLVLLAVCQMNVLVLGVLLELNALLQFWLVVGVRAVVVS